MELVAVFAPLIGFLIAGIFGRYIGDRASQFVTCAGVFAACIASVILFYEVILEQQSYTKIISEWIVSGDFVSHWALRIDALSVVMMCVVNIVSACVHVYSIGYMSSDSSKSRFFAYLSLFTFAMLMLVSADNIIQLFFGWEGVGLTSYLLIGFWNEKESANNASIKAFMMNRMGDFGFVIGVMSVFVLFGSLDFQTIFNSVDEKTSVYFEVCGINVHALTAVCLLLFVGACAKSAQLGLHTWLPDAMEGPTPVSALIHAATMVTAGVFLLIRFSPLYESAPLALEVVCVLGALTAFVAATIALVQNDIKRVIAYSTMSQLGYMFLAIGVSAYSAAIFHLTTHAFFKALLFLGAGSVIHAMSNEQDMRKMGGIWKLIPSTYVLMWIGSLALAGIPFFAGYYSKDIILESAWASHSMFGEFAFWMGILAAVMTAFYTWRMLLMTFHGKNHADDKVVAHIHESPRVMLYPLAVLASLAIFAGFALHSSFVGTEQPEIVQDDNGDSYMVGLNRDMFWGDSLYVKAENDSVEHAHQVPLIVKILPVIAGAAGIFIAYILFYPLNTIWVKACELPVLKQLRTLFANKWYFDDIYNAVFLKNSFRIGEFFSMNAEKRIIDRYGPNGIAKASIALGAWFSKLHTGYIYHYAFVMIIGVILLASWYFIITNAGGVQW